MSMGCDAGVGHVCMVCVAFGRSMIMSSVGAVRISTMTVINRSLTRVSVVVRRVGAVRISTVSVLLTSLAASVSVICISRINSHTV